MSKCINLTGQKFGRLLVLERTKNNSRNHAQWICQCDCGNTVTVTCASLRSGNTKSCGCTRKEKLSAFRTKHKKSETKIYKKWSSMIGRCYCKGATRYENYGGRGIKVCDEWLHNFQAFYEWAMANGYSDDLTLDRKDVNGNYCPENCRWATQKEQANNRRNNHYLTYNGETHTITKWAEIKGLNPNTLKSRIYYLHWDIERALNT